MPMTELSELVGRDIASRKNPKSHTRKACGACLVKSATFVSNGIRRNLSPKFASLEKLAEALNCAVMNFFQDQGENVPANEASIAEMIKTLSPSAREDFLEMIAVSARCWGKHISKKQK